MLTYFRDVGGTLVPRVIEPVFPGIRWRLERGPHGNSNERKIAALTFDDGPTANGTEELLDVLEEFAVPATHFLLGASAEREPRLVERMLAAGHAIGNHSWDHPDGWRTRTVDFLESFNRTARLLESMVGNAVPLVRPPYGKLTPALVRWTHERDCEFVMWDTMPADFSVRATVDSVSRRTANLRPRSIVCLHDNAESRRVTPEALRRTLPRLIDEGWEFTARW